jgi:dTDP-4-dehydrorhamnose reductase
VKHVPEVWAGPECSFLRVGDWACDQLALTGHQQRISDLDLLADLGVTAVRYPVLWGRTARHREATDWAWADRRLKRLADLGIRPIAGLLHHGFGPEGMDPLDPRWPERFGQYALEVARRYPSVTDFLPINEPLTTARFAGLYGWWPPYGRTHETFVRLVLAQAEAYVAAARAIRSIRPDARILVNEDLGRTMGGPGCGSRARRDSDRRWLTFDLADGRVDASHPWWSLLATSPRNRRSLDALRREPERPNVLGIDYYVTSDRYLDERLWHFPAETHGGDEAGPYADVEVVRVAGLEIAGFEACISETWARYGHPVALTEVHLAGEPNDQVAWWEEAVAAAHRTAAGGVPIVGVTAWSAFGAFDWSSVLRRPSGSYATGCYAPRADGQLELTPLGRAVKSTALRESSDREPGWWRRMDRALFDPEGGVAARAA